MPHLSWLYFISPILSIIFLINLQWKSKAILNWHDMSASTDYSSKDDDISFGKISFKQSVVRFVSFKLAIVCFILAIIGPKSGGEMKETTSEGVELMIALDLSKSMLAEDIAPNRLYAAKRAIKSTINALQGDLVGLVVFAGNAYVQMPISRDYGSAMAYLESVNTLSVATQGTSLSSAIKQCLNGFNESSKASKIMFIFTDGEDHEEGIESAISNAKELNVKISCIGIGSITGAPIPDTSSG